MKRYLIVIAVGGLALVGAILYFGVPTDYGKRTATQPAPSVAPADPAANGITGKVVETMNSGGYTYVRVDTGREQIWAAAPEVAVKVGDMIATPPGMPMKDFESEPLQRTFDMIYFVPAIDVGGSDGAKRMPFGHPRVSATDEDVSKIDFADVQKPAGGFTVADIYAGKAALKGKAVTLRGKVVKFVPGVMGKNWVHVRDGTGEEGANDLTVTTDAVAKVGDTVLVKGVVLLDQDLGFGYKYDVLITDADVTVE